MATAEELLASRSSNDKTLIIDNNLRKIQIPSIITNLGVENDDDVLRLEFRMPRYLGDTDLSTFTVRINYMNANGESDVYSVDDLKIVGENLTFSWLVGPTATAYKGDTKFNVCMKIVDADGYIQKEYNTTIATLPVLEGLEAEEGLIRYYSDILEQWKRQLFGIGDTEEANLTAKSEEEQENITQKGIEVLATIPEDYQTTYEMANNAYRTRANAIVSTEQGEVINLDDSSNDPLRGLRLFGKTTQITTTGKNLLKVTAVSTTVSGVTYTVNPDGTVIANGTANAVSTLILNSSFTFEAGIGYTLSGCPSGGGVDKYRLDDVSKIADDGAGGSVVYSESTTTQIRIRIANGVAVNNLLFKPMIRLTSIEDNSFEPYSGGLASPSADCPQSLTSIVEPTVKIHNTNIFGGSALADKIYAVSKATTSVKDEDAGTVTYSGGGINTAVLFDNFKTNQQYTFVLYGQNTTAPDGYSYTNLAFLYDDYTIGPSNPRFNVRGEDSYCVVTSEAGKTVKALIGKWASGTVIIYYDKCGLFEGVKTVDDFEPYCEQSITLDYILPGIPVSSGGNYTDANGQQWICDEIDFERGVYIKRVNTRVFDGSEAWLIGEQNAEEGYLGVFYTAANDMVAGSTARCSRYMQGNSVGLIGKDGQFDTYYSQLRINIGSFTSVEEWTLQLAEWNDAGAPLTLCYILTEPIETELTAEELVTFGALHTNYPNTTILNDSGAMMEVKYNEDLKFYANEIMEDAASVVITQDKIQVAVDNWLSAHYSSAEGVSF